MLCETVLGEESLYSTFFESLFSKVRSSVLTQVQSSILDLEFEVPKFQRFDPNVILFLTITLKLVRLFKQKVDSVSTESSMVNILSQK